MLILIKSEQGRSSSFVDLKRSHFCLERTKTELYSRNKFYFIQLESNVAVKKSVNKVTGAFFADLSS